MYLRYIEIQGVLCTGVNNYPVKPFTDLSRSQSSGRWDCTGDCCLWDGSHMPSARGSRYDSFFCTAKVMALINFLIYMYSLCIPKMYKLAVYTACCEVSEHKKDLVSWAIYVSNTFIK